MNTQIFKRSIQYWTAVLLILVITVGFPAAALASETQNTGSASAVSENADRILCGYLDGKRACAMTGTPQDGWIRAKVPNCSMDYYASLPDEMLALSQNKTDFFIIPTVNFNLVKDGYPDLCQTEVPATLQGISYMMAKTDEGDALRKEINAYIQSLSSSGELEKLQQYWLFSDQVKEPVNIPETGEKGVLKLAATSSLMPYVYKIRNEFTGFEIDILASFCREYGYGLQINDMDFAAILPGVVSGKYDLGCSGISATDERRKSAYFCDYTYVQSFQFVMRADDVPEGVGIALQASSGENQTITERLYNNFFAEERWKLILDGTLVTIGVTVLSAFFGTMLGYVICRMRISGKPILSGFAKGYIYLLSGMPQVLLLLIFCFIIFGKSELSGFPIAVIAFSFNFSATVAELLRNGISLVDKGQTEAMLTLGYTENASFRKIILPQAIRNSSSVYKGQVIALLKATSVVGYIAVQDVTKVADIIRSRTFDAFIPLFFAGFIYFLLAALLIRLLGLIDRKAAADLKDPRETNRLKGVKLHE